MCFGLAFMSFSLGQIFIIFELPSIHRLHATPTRFGRIGQIQSH
jgi:hypothetical protein